METSTSKKKKQKHTQSPASSPTSLAHRLEAEARAIEAPPVAIHMSLATYLKEAMHVASFVDARWLPTAEIPVGLVAMEARLPADTGPAIAYLVEAARAAHKKARVVTTLEDTQIQRGRFILREIRLALELVADDGVRDPLDDEVSALGAAHSADPRVIADLAHALGDYCDLAASTRDRLREVPPFDVALVEEGRALAKALLTRGAPNGAGDPARVARDRYLALLDARVALARRVARYVFRAYPAIVRGVTSAHLRGKRRRQRGGAPEPTEPSPTPEG